MKKNFMFIAAILGWAMSASAQTIHTYGVNNNEVSLCHVTSGDTVISGGYARRNASGQTLSRLGAMVTWFVEGSGFIRSEYFDTPANDKVVGLDIIHGRLFATVSSDQAAGTPFVRVLEDSAGVMVVKDVVGLPSGLEITATSSDQQIFMVGSTGSIFPDMVFGAYAPGDTITLRAVVMPQVQRLYDVALANDSLLVAVGQGTAASASSSGVLIVGFRPNLDTVFTKTILIGNAEIGYGVTVVDSSLAYVVGRSNQGLGNYYAFVLPINPNTGDPYGTTALVYGQSGNEVAYGVAHRNDTLCVVGEAPDASGNPNAMRLFVDATTPAALFLLDSLDFGVSGQEDGLYSVSSEGLCWVAVGQIHMAKSTALAAQGLVYLEGDCYLPLVPTSLEERRQDVLSVYPNPIASRGIVKIAGLKKRTNWKLFNALGQVVFYGEAVPGSEMQVPEIPGVYFLRFEGEQSTIKILVQ